MNSQGPAKGPAPALSSLVLWAVKLCGTFFQDNRSNVPLELRHVTHSVKVIYL